MASEADRRDSDKDRTRQLGAFAVVALALLLTLGSIGDANATESAARNNVLAADTYAFYQAKNIRQRSYELAADDLRYTLSAASSDLSREERSEQEERLAFYEETIARYESEPDPGHPNDLLKGEGKVQLLAQARNYEDEVRDARQRGASFDYATAAAQIGIVLASAAILMISRRLLAVSAAAGLISLVFLGNVLLPVVDVTFHIG